MRGRLRRLAGSLGPSLVASAFAALAAGLVEAIPETGSVAEAVGATGFLAILALPIGLGVSLVVRGLWWAWRPQALVASLREPDGGSPRLTAWLLYLLVAVIGLVSTVFVATRFVLGAANDNVAVLLAAPVIALVPSLILVALSRPTVAGLAYLLGGLERRFVARFARPLFTPARTLVVLGLAVGGLLVGAWVVSFAPRLGTFDLGFLYALVAWAVVLLAVPAGLARLRRVRLVSALASGLALALAAGALATAAYLRVAEPFAMLEIWGETRMSGYAIDVLYDVESLRDEIQLEGIEPEARPGAAHPDIILITIDTVRADMTPPYGGPSHMPALGDFGRAHIVFERTYSPGNVTRRSLPSIATGLSPDRVKGRVAGWALKLDPRHVLLAERFRAAGYDTAGFFCCDSQFGGRHELGLIRGIDHIEIENDGGKLGELARDYLKARPEGAGRRPLFMWVHFIEPHNWEKDYPVSEHARSRRERYGLSLAEVDGYLGTVLDAAWATPRRDHTVIVVTADHGEGLGDHGKKNHATSLYDSEIRVPLVIAVPGLAPRRIERPVSLTDLAPTLLDLAGYVPPGMPQMDGRSFAALVAGKAPAELDVGTAYTVMLKDRSVADTMRAWIHGRWKLIDRGDGKVELFDLVSDPFEARNLAASKPDVLAQLEAELSDRRESDFVSPF